MTPALMDFEGVWRVDRAISHRNGPEARFDGQAVFASDNGGLVYREDGHLHMPGQPPIRAERRYLWRVGQAGGIDVCFDDGRAFHRIGVGGVPEDRHYCDPDIYDVTYDFSAWPVWTSHWEVSGPRKDYTMVTRYSRG